MNEGHQIEGTVRWRSCARGLRSWLEWNMSGPLDLVGDQIGRLSSGGGVQTITPWGWFGSRGYSFYQALVWW